MFIKITFRNDKSVNILAIGLFLAAVVNAFKQNWELAGFLYLAAELSSLHSKLDK